MRVPRPHILFVVLDSVRPDWLGCYGSGVDNSPNIDALAARSLLFETAITASSWTFPAMASVFTGMVPSKHGGHDETMFLDKTYPTLAEVFQRNGYDTAAFADVPYVGQMTGLDRGFLTMSNMRSDQVSLRSKVLKAVGRLHRTVARGYRKTNETPVVMGEAMDWLEHRRDRSRPFLLYIHTDETHAPFLPPARFRRRFTRLLASGMHALNQDKQDFISGSQAMAAGEFAHLLDLARAEVAYFDAWLGRLFERMERLGLLKDTVIVLAADHGENLGEHGLLRHALCLYDTLLRVPLILHVPGRPAARILPMVRLIDLLPTLMAAAGIDEPQTTSECMGSNLLDAVDHQRFPEVVVSELYRPSAESREMWARKAPEFLAEYVARFDRRLRSYRTATHKLIWSSNGRHELYDLSRDPAEEDNLIDREPALSERMMSDLQRWLNSYRHAGEEAPVGARTEVDEVVMERLRDLGYID